MIKAFFILEIFTFLSRLFDYVEKLFDRKTKVNFKIYDVIDWIKSILIYKYQQNSTTINASPT